MRKLSNRARKYIESGDIDLVQIIGDLRKENYNKFGLAIASEYQAFGYIEWVAGQIDAELDHKRESDDFLTDDIPF